jgi:hypothetical protein
MQRYKKKRKPLSREDEFSVGNGGWDVWEQ